MLAIPLGLAAPAGIGAQAVAAASPAYMATGIAGLAQNVRREAPSTRLKLTAWLGLHDRAGFDALVRDLYTPGSPRYRAWLTNAELKRFMPTSAEIEAVSAELGAHGLVVDAVDPLNLSIRFHGSTAAVESAFHTTISVQTVKGLRVRTTSSLPQLWNAAGALVQGVSGLNSVPGQPLYARATNPRSGRPFAAVKVSHAGKPLGAVFSGNCFYAPQTVSLSGVNAFDGTTPVSETLSGLTYGAPPSNTTDGTLSPCGYSAAQVQGFYGMGAPYKRGYNGAGQTIVIVDAYAQPTAMSDANVFSTLMKLPAFTSSSFRLYNVDGVTQLGSAYGTAIETDIDVQWAHALAPGANIALVEAFSEDEEDIQNALSYAVVHDLGKIVSLSYGQPEAFTSPYALGIFNQISELAAAKGISIQVSSGDSGDFTPDGIAADVNGWGSSPYGTSVGGTSIGTDPGSGHVYQAGWGNNLGYFTFGTGYLVDPPTSYSAFDFGSGGGASAFFAKPAYQHALPGSRRLMPDVSALADPFTGAEIVYDDPSTGDTYVTVYGGTSLASPIFSGMWATVDQYEGKSLGQAAPVIASLPYPLLTDIVPLSGPANATATVTDPTGTITYSAAQLSAPLSGTTNFLSGIWQEDTGGDYLNISFGTDTSLTTAKGWDNVTGYGTPNMGAIFGVLK